MKGLIADANIQGQVSALVTMMQTEPWKSFWDHLQVRLFEFSDVGLTPAASDALVWQTCQREELVLITDNRNQADADSLEATIRLHNTPSSLPVLTIANVSRLRRNRVYVDLVIERILDILLRIDSVRGSGRLYVP